MRNETIANTGITVAILTGAGGLLAMTEAGRRSNVASMRVSDATTLIASARQRQTLPTPPLFGPDSPQALDDVIRGAEEALPGLRTASRNAIRGVMGIAAATLLVSGAAMVVHSAYSK